MRKPLVIAGVLLLAACFAYGVLNLFQEKFSRGDIYPAYSSLRSDPLGVKAYYESLDSIGITVSRNYDPLLNLAPQYGSALLFIGQQPTPDESTPLKLAQELESFVTSGGRLVVAYLPPDTDSPAWTAKAEKPKNTEEPETDEISLTKRWGLRPEIAAPGTSGDEANVEEPFAGHLPATISWHSRLYFGKPGHGWRDIYSAGGRPVMIERRMGLGSIVFSGDSYFFSNEALLRDREPALLAWIIGDRTRVVFDEYTHGVGNSPGVAMLLRRYGLVPLVAAMLLLVALFAWKNSVPLVPPYAELETAREQGKGSMSGLRNLLRRSIAPNQVLSVCMAEWKKTPGIDANKVVKIGETLPVGGGSGRDREVVGVYNRICGLLRDSPDRRKERT